MLNIQNLHAGYGKIEVLQGISIHVPRGKVVTDRKSTRLNSSHG